MAKIAIIIVTFNSSKHIYDCLESIYKYNDLGDGLEIIIVDNDSQEQKTMFEGIEAKYGEKIILVGSGKNGGYGFGNNIGIKMASSPIVVVMNPDVRLVQPIFNEIINQFNKDNVGMIGVDFVDGSCPYYFKRGHSSIFRSLFFKYYIWRKHYNAEEMYMSGSFLAFNKEGFEKAGGYDENIFMYSEEADITNRMLLQGYKVIWCPQIKVLHMAHGRNFNKFLDRTRLESGVYYEKKYNVDSRKSYNDSVMVLKIKILIASICGQKQKKEILLKSLNNLREFYSERSDLIGKH